MRIRKHGHNIGARQPESNGILRVGATRRIAKIPLRHKNAAESKDERSYSALFDVAQHHFVTGLGEYVRDAVAHGARAQHPDDLDLHECRAAGYENREVSAEAVAGRWPPA